MPSMEPSDHFDAVVGRIGFVRHRDADRTWALRRKADPQYHTLAWAARGRAHYECDDRRFTVSKGQFVYFARGVGHAAKADVDQPWSFYSVAFELKAHDRQVLRRFDRLPCTAEADGAIGVEPLFAELARLWVARESGYLLRCRAIVMTLLYSFVRCCAEPTGAVPHARRIQKVVRLLQDHYARSYSVDELSEMVDLSASRFSVLFKQVTDYPVVRYQNWLRMNKAKDLLLSGEYSVTEAAAAVGFDDVYYFSRLFKKMTGENASTYRNR